MAVYSSEVFQNEFLPDGGTDVNAIVSITVDDAGKAGSDGAAGEIIIIDCSGSMGMRTMAAARSAAITAIDNILDDTYFAVVSGTHEAFLAYPVVQSGPGMVKMDEFTRQQAKVAVSRLIADGGTAIGKWLNLTRALFSSMGDIFSQKHALLLTDGADEHETPAQLNAAIEACRGQFQCDCRGVGTYWVVSEIRKISNALMGTLGFISDPNRLSEEFASIMQASMNRGVSEANLRVWTPQGAQLLFVRQVSPEVDDMTNKGRAVSQLVVEYPTGAWGDETREYHVSVRIPAKNIGMEQLAARVQLVVDNQPKTQGLVKAIWSQNDSLTAQINSEVAHYTGQTELAQTIQEGLAARKAGDLSTATARLGRAVQLADQTGNDEAAEKLSRVVDVVDISTGTVRLRQQVNKADEMALDTASTKTTRIRNRGKDEQQRP
ncbi:VWA domain-containing protein [Propionimicrobium sp. BV2F7]|uniref:vWA domain-containing protein n=1 Tax=Propionimicrobium sp. BV2F7 TaxID=1111131 RepID=UPI0003D79CE0|nr:VWA domain-containing protein [Propionimicrobium sp. BV2F7]ETJ96933.1 von Willebrand factor type A domain protein [Propionimicrobium sp. BV2F7]